MRILRKALLIIVALAILFCATWLGIIWYANIDGVFDRDTRWQLTRTDSDRDWKRNYYKQLLAKEQTPEIVLFGSSRAMKFEPDYLGQRIGKRGSGRDVRVFNFAVSGATTNDAKILARYLDHMQSEEYPQLIWMLDVVAFRDKQLDDGFHVDSQMKRFASDNWSTVEYLANRETMQRSLKQLEEHKPWKSFTAPITDSYDAHGMQLWERRLGEGEAAQTRLIDRQMRSYTRAIFQRDQFTSITQKAVNELRDVIEIANKRGRQPLIVLLPEHPHAQEILEAHEMERLNAAAKDSLARLQNPDLALDFEYVAFDTIADFSGSAAEFYDGVHMTPVNTRKVIDELEARGLLDRF